MSEPEEEEEEVLPLPIEERTVTLCEVEQGLRLALDRRWVLDVVDGPLDPLLTIARLDPWFAPGVEELVVEYEAWHLDGRKVRVEVTSEAHGEAPLLSRELTPEELEPGVHVLRWDGRTTCQEGPLRGQHVSPLFAPYRLSLVLEDGTSVGAPFAVLYHSLSLRLGPWTADGEAPDRKTDEERWLRWALNELGLWAGPDRDYTPEGTTERYLDKAIKRFKARTKGFHRRRPAEYDAATSPALLDAVQAALDARAPGGPSPFLRDLAGSAFDGADGRAAVRLEAPLYGELTAADDELEAHLRDELDPVATTAARLNRPLFPLEAVVLLRGKDDRAVETPGGAGVGPVRVVWRARDPLETLTRLPPAEGEPANSRTRRYVQRVFGGRGIDDCLVEDGGIRVASDGGRSTPLLGGDLYPPFQATLVGEDVHVDAHAGADHPARRGRAGVLVRTSLIAGDDYTFTARLEWGHLPNKDALDGLHLLQPIEASTGTFEVRRVLPVAAVVSWPRPKADVQATLAAARGELALAHVDLELDGAAFVAISDVWSSAEYEAQVRASSPSQLREPVALSPDQLIGYPPPDQESRSLADHGTVVRQLWVRDFQDTVLAKGPFVAALTDAVRKEHPHGLVVVAVLTHQPLQANGGTIPSTALTSVGFADGLILLDDLDKTPGATLTHEIGHCLFLSHFENAGGAYPAHHDAADHNCTMSYPIDPALTDDAKAEEKLKEHPHWHIDRWKPHFCGRCNLKLRGWGLGRTPASSDPTPPSTPTALRLQLHDATARPSGGRAWELYRGANVVASGTTDPEGWLELEPPPGDDPLVVAWRIADDADLVHVPLPRTSDAKSDAWHLERIRALGFQHAKDETVVYRFQAATGLGATGTLDEATRARVREITDGGHGSLGEALGEGMSGESKVVKLAPTRPLYLAIDGTMSHDSTHLGRLLEKKGWAENLLDLLPAAKETGRREPGFLLRHLPIVRVDDKTAPTNDARRGATVCLPGGVNGWGQEGFWRAWSEGSGADERVAKVDWGDGLVTYGRHTAAERSARAVPSLFLHAAVEIAWGVGGQDPARLVADPSAIDVLSEVARPDLVFVSSHGFMGGTFRGDGLLAWGAAEPKTVGAGHTAPTKGYFPSSNYFTLGQAVASGEKFMGPKWLILALCSAANEATWPLWVTLFARSTPQVRGLLAYEESAPSAAGAITTSEAFVSHIAAGKTMLEAWREANDARKQKWAAVVHEDAHEDTLSAFGALAKLDPKKKWVGYRPGEAGVEVPPETKGPFELVVESAWRNDDGTLGDWEEAKPETLDGAHLSPGNPYRVTVRPPAGKKARSAAVELIHVREARPRVPWRQVFTAPAATSKATAATLDGTASIRLEAQAGHDGKELQAQFDAEKSPPDRGHSYWWFKVKLELDDGSSPEHPFRLQGYMW